MASDKLYKVYDMFHKLPPNKGWKLPDSLVPEQLVNVGSVKTTYYVSDKWEGEWNGYVHDHAGGVNFYKNSKTARGDIVTIPDNFRKIKELWVLGYCDGVEYVPEDNELKTEKFPHSANVLLAANIECNCLYIIKNKRLVGLIYGGMMTISDHGIIW